MVEKMENSLTLSDNAAKRITFLRDKEGDDNLMLRLTVLGGGCSGFQYEFSFDNQTKDDDHIFNNGSVAVITDTASLDLLAGSTIDYVEELIGSSFKVKNPNAESGCGCGVSFSIGRDMF
jgi:iron-sulfur cluster insertion protein